MCEGLFDDGEAHFGNDGFLLFLVDRNGGNGRVGSQL